ncbi:MAG: Phospholipase [Solirubrobacterales bacterium]|nr:Phospholipase [Solirubrobacterales bacterium]
MRRWTLVLLGLVTALSAAPARATTTPINHVVVVFDENISFDHYFGTYPTAANPAGEPAFTARAGTPAVNGLSGALLTANPNGVNPFRLGRAQAATCDNGHTYTAEQQAFHAGLMDKFVTFTSCPGNTGMGYYDGNTVTALWNYAQAYALSDATFGTVFGPSTPGALNLISGQTHGASPDIADAVVNGTVIADPDPAGDQCGNRTLAQTVSFGAAPNIGTLLSAKGVTWGWFQGGFRPTGSDGGGAVCGSSHTNIAGASVRDYSAHHEPFQYYAATRNTSHLAPASAAQIGHDELGVNHQYDLTDFQTALSTGNVPAVSFLKAASYQDGHAGYSDPLDEQRFLVQTINAIQASNVWSDTAIVIAYDDSDGWYDHQASPIVNRSNDPTYDALDGAGQCTGPGVAPPVAGGHQLRCGFGPRLPLLVISPYGRMNYVDHTMIDQTSILRFIEDNWETGQVGGSSFDDIPSPKPTIAGLFDFAPAATRAAPLLLDPSTGAPPGAPVTPSPPVTTPPPTTTPTPTPTVTPRALRAFKVRVTPHRDRRAPYRFALSGTLTLPSGVAAASACKGTVSVGVYVGGKRLAKRTVMLRGKCTWTLRLAFANRRKLGSGRLSIRVAFAGNALLRPSAVTKLAVRAG